MAEMAQTGYLQRLEAELDASDSELAELEVALYAGLGERGPCARQDELPELAWARAHCEALQGWVQTLRWRDPPERPFSPEDPLHARTEHARNRLQRARAQVHERLLMLRQEAAFQCEARLRALEDAYARAEVRHAGAPFALGWLRMELHAGWRLLERMLRAEDRDWLGARRDLERALGALDRSSARIAPGPLQLRLA